MRSKIDIGIVSLSGLIFLLSLLALLVNSLNSKYPGNNYFPPNTIQIGLYLVLFYAGLNLQFEKNRNLTKIGLELIYFFLIMCLIVLATNAVQLSPFPPIDKYIVSLENYLNFDMNSVLAWTHLHPTAHLILAFSYDSLTTQMCIIPLLIIAMRRFDLIHEYYFLLLLSALFGFGFYYFYPTTAPASIISSPYFTAYQVATGLKFNEIHNHIMPSTIEGGLIALPSFHCVWALFCIYLLKDFKILCLILSLINLLLIASCVMLGWHYPIDIIAGFALAGFCYWALTWCKSKTSTHRKSIKPF